jgi:hypothetical protein
LLYLINSVGFTSLLKTWQSLNPRFQDPADKLYGFIFSHCLYYGEHMHEMRVMTWGTHTLTPENAGKIKELKGQYLNSCIDILKEFPGQGPETISELSLQRQTYLLFGMMNWLFAWYEPANHGSHEELVNDIYRTFLVGFAGSSTHLDLNGLSQKAADLLSTPAPCSDVVKSNFIPKNKRHARLHDHDQNKLIGDEHRSPETPGLTGSPGKPDVFGHKKAG